MTLNPLDFIQLGIAGIALIVLLLVVRDVMKNNKEIMNHIAEKDTRFIEFIKKQEDNFNDMTKNHLHADTEAKNKLEQSNAGLTKVIDQLIRFLEKNNR